MKKILLSMAVVMTALSANAQVATLNAEKMADKAQQTFNLEASNSEVFVKNANAAKKAGKAGDVETLIELGSSNSDGVYEDKVTCYETSGVTMEYTGETGEYKGNVYPTVVITGIGAGYCTVTGYMDEANGKIYIPRQFAYEYPDASKGYGRMMLEALVIVDNQLDWNGTDLVLYKTASGWQAWDGTEEEGAIYGWVITMVEYKDGFDETTGQAAIWTYGIASNYLAANGVETENNNSSGSWAPYEFPVYIDDQGDEVAVYNFVGASAIGMLVDEGDVYIPVGQPIAVMPASWGYPTEGYGEYFRTYAYVLDGESIHIDFEAEYSMATREDNVITMGEDGYLGIWSKFDEDSRGYRMGIYNNLTWTINSDETAIKNVNASTQKGDNKFYNIAGQRVEANTPGIVIRNGKKYMNK